jgi:TRAP-type uncharacterized transport system substrate-binding protein
MTDPHNNHPPRLWTPLEENFGLNPKVAMLLVVGSIVFLAVTVFWFFYSAPPTTITITSGPPGSSFATNAIQYSKILARNGVTLKILPSEGSTENLDRLNDRSKAVDVGFVLVSPDEHKTNSDLMSLSSIAYQPLLIFYRSPAPVTLLSEFNGKRIAIGPPGSGTRSLAMALLQLNDIGTNDSTLLLDLDAAEAADALLKGSLDAVFMMGDSASPQILRGLLLSPGIRLYNFIQADGYVRRIPYLNKLEIPMGSLDFGKNIPSQDLALVGPTVELVARPKLHPALSDLLLEAAQEVHGEAKLFQHKGEFPVPLAYNFPISPDAARFYKSGKPILYRWLPFWLASLVKRILVSFVPLLVVTIPLVRAVPALYKWRVSLMINRRYRSLLKLERESLGSLTPRQRSEMLARLGQIEDSLHKMRVPASFANLFYSLRGHLDYVRSRLVAPGEAPASPQH